MKNLFPILLFITCHAVGQTTTKIYWAYNDGVYTDITPKSTWNYANGLPMKHNPITGELQDTIPGYMHTRGTYIPGDSSTLERLNIRFRKVIVQEVNMGMKSVYIPETDREEGNGINQKSKVIVYQIAMDDVITEEQKEKIKQVIDLIMFNSPGTPIVIATVDAVNSTFVGKWSHVESSTANWYGETLSFSNEKDAYATYKDPLPYKRVEIWSEKKDTHGKIEVSVDGVVIGDPIDLYSPNYEIPFMVFGMDLPLGIHEIKYRIIGEKNPASRNTYGLLDYFRFVR